MLVATPIGNLGDMTARAREELSNVDLLLCEDTRRTGHLLLAAGLSARTQTLHEHNEDARIAATLARIRDGQRIALVSDAGTPLVSDPGYRLVRAVIAAGLPLTTVPGPNAAITALVLSGLPPMPFLVLGFPPPRQAARRTAFARLKSAESGGLDATLIWYEAPHRLLETLTDLHAVLGDRPAAVTRELTKRFEEVRRGTLGALAAHYQTNDARGEITIVVGPPGETVPDQGAVDASLRLALRDHSLKDAAALVARATGQPRKLIYARALELARKPEVTNEL